MHREGNYRFRIRSIECSNGKRFALGSLTVLIGPNNSGKSRALRDIITLTTSHNEGLVVRAVEMELPHSKSDLFEGLGQVPARTGDRTRFECISPGLTESWWCETDKPWVEEFEQSGLNPELRRRSFRENASKAVVALLTTDTRLLLASESNGVNVQFGQGMEEKLIHLFRRDGNAEESLRAAVKAAFPGTDIRFDIFSRPGQYLFRVGADFNDAPTDWRDLGNYFEGFRVLDEEGDGIRSFVGTVAAIKALPRRVILVDEPEAFLHPPQAFNLGVFVAQEARAGRQIIVATHSADFLRGAVSQGPEVNILRIERTTSCNDVSSMNAEDVLALGRDPMRSAARVLDGLFYRGVVVVEADSDARIYHSLLQKLYGLADWHFVNASNKQTVPALVEPYRRLGVRACGIVDFDVLRDRTEFQRQLGSFGLSAEDGSRLLRLRDAISAEIDATPLIERLGTVRNSIAGILDEVQANLDAANENDAALTENIERVLSGLRNKLDRVRDSSNAWAKFKQRGHRELSPEGNTAFADLYSTCKAHGLFINPLGELEASLSELGVPFAKDQEWTRRALTLIPNLMPDLATQPWKFVADVNKYLQQIK